MQPDNPADAPLATSSAPLRTPLGVLRFVERLLVGGALLAAIAIMLTGVILRYVFVPITNALDLNAISFFWVEEAGELLLTWLALVGGAIAIGERAHFTVNLLVHKLSPGVQRGVLVFNALVIAAFGGLLAWQGWRLAVLNWSLGTPALDVSLGWFYAATVAGGILIIPYALATASQPPPDPLDIKAE